MCQHILQIDRIVVGANDGYEAKVRNRSHRGHTEATAVTDNAESVQCQNILQCLQGSSLLPF